MRSAHQVVAGMVLASVLDLRARLEHIVRRGGREVWVSGEKGPIAPRDANKRMISLLEHRLIKSAILPSDCTMLRTGFADAVSILGLNDPIMGRWMYSNRIYNRQPIASNCQYGILGPSNDPNAPWASCESGMHNRGQVLAGIWTRIKSGMVAAHGAVDGLELARQLHVNWMFLTAGGDPPASEDESAHPGTLYEVLAAGTDGNGNIPDCQIIADAFAAHNIPCVQPNCPCP